MESRIIGALLAVGLAILVVMIGARMRSKRKDSEEDADG